MNVFLSICVFLILSGSLAAQDFAAGKVTESVSCTEYPGQSYALYLPSRYDPSKKWPILYGFDARAEGKESLELFREGAEKYGYIVVSSNNSMSDDPTAANLQAMTAMWEDTHHRFSIDPARSYATGFSGGARIACDMGYRYRGAVAGVIGCGAGFPIDKTPSQDTPFVYFGTIGFRDFNFYEMRSLAVKLRDTGVPYRIRPFDGGHQWPPPEICTEALQWMEVQAMKRKLRPVDSSIVQAAYELRLAQAQAAQTAGKIYEAAGLYSAIAMDFEGLREVEEVTRKSGALRAEGSYTAQEELWKRRDREGVEFELKLASVVRSLQTSSRVPSPETVMAFLDVPNLQKKLADTSNPEESDHARRLLDSVSAQTSFYLPRTFLERGDYDRAAVVLTVSTTIHPEYSWSWYYLARAQAQLGQVERGMDALRKAVDAGFADAEKMESDVDMRPLKDQKNFRKLVSRARDNARKQAPNKE